MSSLIVNSHCLFNSVFSLSDNELSYFNETGVKRGFILLTADTTVSIIDSSEADEKSFPFCITTNSDSYVIFDMLFL